jgi:hypothetical protein
MEFAEFFTGWFALLLLILPFALFIAIATAWIGALVAAVSAIVSARAARVSLQKG